MVCDKLIRQIETHEGEITDCIMAEINRDSGLTQLRKLVAESELRGRSCAIVKHLCRWLAGCNQEEMAKECEALGGRRFEEDIPLHELVRVTLIIKDKILDFVDEQGFDPHAPLSAGEELERRVDRFFGMLAIHLVRGYEAAWHHAVHAAA